MLRFILAAVVISAIPLSAQNIDACGGKITVIHTENYLEPYISYNSKECDSIKIRERAEREFKSPDYRTANQRVHVLFQQASPSAGDYTIVALKDGEVVGRMHSGRPSAGWSDSRYYRGSVTWRPTGLNPLPVALPIEFVLIRNAGSAHVLKFIVEPE